VLVFRGKQKPLQLLFYTAAVSLFFRIAEERAKIFGR
jgi:hypothetical protein